MVFNRYLGLVVFVALFGAWLLLDSGAESAKVLGISISLSDLINLKIITFFNRLDFDGDGVLEIQDYQSLGDCYIREMNLGVEIANRIRDQAIPEQWKLLGFNSAGLGNQITVDKLLTLIGSLQNSANYKKVLRDIFTMGFDAYRSYTTDETLSYKPYHSYCICAEIEEEVCSASFAKMDTSGDGRLGLEEFIAAGIDFFTGEDGNGPGAFLLGKPKKLL